MEEELRRGSDRLHFIHTNQTDVKLAFDVLCGVKNIAEAKHLLPPNLAATCNQQTNAHWSQPAHWVRRWTRKRILKMFLRPTLYEITKTGTQHPILAMPSSP